MAHALFIVNGRIAVSIYLMATMEETTLVCPLIHSRLLSRNSQEILMKVSAKWPPDRVVVSLANQALFWGIALKPQTAEFDHDFIGTEWRHDVGAQRRTTQIEVHPWEKIDHLPMVGWQMRKRKLFSGFKALILIILHFKRAYVHMAVFKPFILSGEI